MSQIETHPFHQQVKAQQLIQEYHIQIEAWGRSLRGKTIFHNNVRRAIGDNHGKRIAHIILRWLTQRNGIAIPESVRKERMAENFNVFDFELRADDMSTIAMLDSKQSACFDHHDPAMVKGIGTRNIHD